MAVLPAPYRFNVEEYHRMAEVGLLPPDARTELLDGEIVEMSPIGSRHADCVARFTHALVRRFDARAIVWVQSAIRLDDHAEPQPDVALLRNADYSDGLPGPGDVFVLVEVADTTVGFDRLRKMPMYARAGIVEAWLVDIEARIIERYRDPADGTYGQVDRLASGDTITITTAFAPDVTFEVNDFIR